jgi:thioredoxin-like negative regulator of GroEL
VDKNPELAARYGVSSIPVFLVFKQGKIVAQHLGITAEATLREQLAE